MQTLNSIISIQSIIPEMIETRCIELSKDNTIMYIAGKLKKKLARKSSPIVGINVESGDVEGKTKAKCNSRDF